MADKTLNNIRIQNKHKTSAQWDQSSDFIPLAGEIIIYDDLNKMKIGDGVTTIANLPFTNENAYTEEEIDTLWNEVKV